jgi:hypothetical protein
MRTANVAAFKLAGDLGNVIEGTSIRGRRSDFFTAGKLAPGHLGLLQQYRHIAAQSTSSACPQLAEADIHFPGPRYYSPLRGTG